MTVDMVPSLGRMPILLTLAARTRAWHSVRGTRSGGASKSRDDGARSSFKDLMRMRRYTSPSSNREYRKTLALTLVPTSLKVSG